MTEPGRFAPTMLALALLGTGLAATLHLALSGGIAEDAPAAAVRRPPDDLAPPGPLPAVTDPTGPWVAASLARPLFDPQRRPAAGGGEGPVEALPRLTGVLVGPFGRSAIFAGPGDGKPLVVEEGGRIAGYALVSIRPGEAVLLGPEGQRVLHPAFDPAAPAMTGGSGLVSGLARPPGLATPR